MRVVTVAVMLAVVAFLQHDAIAKCSICYHSSDFPSISDTGDMMLPSAAYPEICIQVILKYI